MATTVKQLIEQLQQIDDQDQLVIFQYYVKQDFEYHDETDVPVQAFENAIERADKFDVWEESRNFLNDLVYEEAHKLDPDNN